MTASNQTPAAIDMSAYWLPFTPNRYFHQHPKIMQSAKGAYYYDDHGRKLFDGLSGLWCSPLGHADPRIGAAISKQFETMDYCPAFQMASEATFSLATRIAKMAPAGLGKVFFTNSGSEAVDTALKMAIAYHRVMGNASRIRMIGRDRAYHGVGMGGISVGGMVANRKAFTSMMMPGVDHLPHTLNLSQMAFSKGQPTWGAHLADELEKIVALHDANTIAAVILEPVQGSTGVIVPPQGYLQKIREICTKHGILLIFDEVITGFGRLGANFGADRFGVVPDMITFAKAITNGVIPLGGVIVRDDIYDSIISNGGQEQAIEFFHGYTYSGHPIPTAAGHAVLDIFESDDLVNRARALEPVLADGLHALKGKSGILDIRNFGLSGAVELEPVAGKPGLRALKVLEACIERGALVRVAGDVIAVGPPFISEPKEVEFLCSVLGDAVDAAMKIHA
ncbi:aspartate aminotransferase family protein [Polynucleobacter sp. UK-Kesae-W10]|uniref:aspartate aminotransferase family protein n=1 Tax=Polynucleobacter sp. UK-Kesae-W10 TaxID=1819738 RepID=UPI001C0CCD4C|nr:aspartate aminotransferase family protein [Polynucleobacter sp. UK-Kesae-W10]MBU3577844.1 aspartate aminotransferase family protein [Polynucleobacter sp. UK-Kesae-W10]